ncbi:MAG: ComEC/Rec2 family competence protein [Elusimicrobia bacterium]|nr:ComEC/Rec2 family competence protein [Elusimicrobiota bacterium]
MAVAGTLREVFRIYSVPLSYFRRPLFLALLAYMSLLAALRARGHFEPRVPPELSRQRFRARVELEGLMVSPKREDNRGDRFMVKASRIGGVPCAQRVAVYFPRLHPEAERLRPGQRLLLEGRLRLPRPARNPGEFHERSWLADQGVGLVFKAERWRVLAPPAGSWRLRQAAESLRRSIERRLREGLGDPHWRLMSGLMMGYKGLLPHQLNRAIQDAGVMHLLVPSGAKVAFVLLGVYAFASWLGLWPWGRMALAAAAGGFYTLLVGGDAPYARAYWTALALGAGVVSGRESGAFQALVIAAWLILLVHPLELFSVGFQMSYLASLGLLLAMPSLDEAVPRSWPRASRRLIGVAAATVIVQVALWPIFAEVFWRAALAGAAGNLVLVPASGFLMGAGFGFWALSLVSPEPLIWLAAQGLRLLLEGFCRACFFFASMPAAAVELAPMSRSGIIVFYLIAASVLVMPRWRASAALAALALSLGLGAALLDHGRAWPLRVYYFNSRESRAALVRFSTGENWLVDARLPGPALSRTLRFLGVARLDRVILTEEGRGLQRGLASLTRCMPVHRIEPRVRTGFAVEMGRVRFEFGPVRVRRGNAEFSIIPSYLKKSGLEVTTDGSQVQIRYPG